MVAEIQEDVSYRHVGWFQRIRQSGRQAVGGTPLRDVTFATEGAATEDRDGGVPPTPLTLPRAAVILAAYVAVLAALNLAFELPDRSAFPEPVASAAKPGKPAASTQPEPQLSALITRLDVALGEDGQLL